MKFLYTTTLIVLIIFVSLPTLLFGAEVDYVQLGREAFEGGGPAQWVRYLFLFGVAVSSIAAVGSLIYAGIVWMTAGSSGRIQGAKDRIQGALLGILIIAGSVLILRTINPDLVTLQNPGVDRETFNQQSPNFGALCDDNNDCNTEQGLYCNIAVGKCLYRATGEGGIGVSCAGQGDRCGEGLFCDTGADFTCQRLPRCSSVVKCPAGFECVGASRNKVGQCQ